MVRRVAHILRNLIVVVTLFGTTLSGILLAQKGADPTQRYFRLICLVHLTGSGQKGDPVVPEYVVQGVVAAQAGIQPHAVGGAPEPPVQPVAPRAAAISSRPGILAWSMQLTDNKHMAIVQLVAADRHAFDAIFADKRSDIRVFEIGKDKTDDIEKELKKFKHDFDLASFQVVAQ